MAEHTAIICATVRASGQVRGGVHADGQVTGHVKSSDVLRAAVHLAAFVGDTPYLGEYTVAPGPTDQVLPTAGKSLLHDITVKRIPFDLTQLTVTPETLAEGVIAINAAGEIIVGTHKCNTGESAKLGAAKLGIMKLGRG